MPPLVWRGVVGSLLTLYLEHLCNGWLFREILKSTIVSGEDVSKPVVLITGASSGFGMGLAEALLKMDYCVYAAARRLEPMEALREKGARLLQMDICDDDSVQSNIKRLLSESGRIDVVVNNAGYGAYGPVENISSSEIEYQFNVNVFGVARVNSAVLPTMRRQGSGRIIVSASLASHICTPGSGWYGATKHAIKAMCESLRMEVAPLGIDVIQIEPGPVQTGFEEVAFAKMDKMVVSDDYIPMMKSFRGFMAQSYAKAPGIESTVKAMVHAATARKPKWIYRTTLESRVVPWLRALLGTRAYARILMKVIARAGAAA